MSDLLPGSDAVHARSRRRASSRRVLLTAGAVGVAGLFVVAPSCTCPRGPPPYVQSCDGGILESCNKNTQTCVLRDCNAENATCEAVDAGARCVPNPPPPCDANFVTQCQGDFLLYCDLSSGTGQGQVVSVDCFDLYATSYAPGFCYDPGGGQATCEYGY